MFDDNRPGTFDPAERHSAYRHRNGRLGDYDPTDRTTGYVEIDYETGEITIHEAGKTMQI
jgi:hypothetical protein